ncbi:MAG: hypothetical protein LBM23_04490 [Propionibacteriaceae bacterium]|nr:hypothetical protein [Propionibacteriaceae bacterium]
MVGTLVKLQLKLFTRQLKSSTATLVLTIIVDTLILLSVIAMLISLIAMRGVDPSALGPLTVSGFATLSICWPLFATLFAGNNAMLDIGRFAIYPIRARELLPGLFLAGLTGIGGVATILLTIGYIIAWSSSPAPTLAAIVGGALGVAFCLVCSRVLAGALSSLFRKRRIRDFMAIFVFLVIFIGAQAINIGAQGLANQGGTVDVEAMMAEMSGTATILGWTPFGWAWALPWSVAQGAWLTFGVQLIGAIAIVALLAWVWARFISRGLVSPLDTTVSGEKVKKSQWTDRLFPYSPAGAIAKRDMRYFLRDPRRLVGNITMLLIPVILAFAMTVSSAGASADDRDVIMTITTYAPIFFSMILCTFVAADICYDGSAIGTQIVAGVSGADDRKGRLMTILLLATPIQVLFIIGFSLYTGHWEQLPGVIGITLTLLLGGAGIGSLVGSIWQYPQPPAGGNMFGKGSTGGVNGLFASLIGMFVPIIIAIPAIVLAVQANTSGNFALFGTLSIVSGLVIGGLCFWAGVSLGGRRLDATWPEVLDRVTWKN